MKSRLARATVKAPKLEYLTRIPSRVPVGKVVVHNHVVPVRPLGRNGFRAWLQTPEDRPLVECNCGWAANLPKHYRVEGKIKGEPAPYDPDRSNDGDGPWSDDERWAWETGTVDLIMDEARDFPDYALAELHIRTTRLMERRGLLDGHDDYRLIKSDPVSDIILEVSGFSDDALGYFWDQLDAFLESQGMFSA